MTPVIAICFNFIFLNPNDLPVTQHDKDVIDRASHVCKVEYKSCLRSLTKISPNEYEAICK